MSLNFKNPKYGIFYVSFSKAYPLGVSLLPGEKHAMGVKPLTQDTSNTPVWGHFSCPTVVSPSKSVFSEGEAPRAMARSMASSSHCHTT